MPKPARFETDQSQRVAVAVVTIAVFAGAMALAALYTSSHKIDHSVALSPKEIHGLQLNLPTDWTEEQDGHGTILLLEDKDDPRTQPRRKIIIQSVGRGVTEAPMDSLRLVWREATGNPMPATVPYGKLHRFRNNSLIGIRYHGRRTEADGKDTRIYALLLTEDARHYWLITLADRDIARAAPEDANIALIDRIAQSAATIATRRASPKDLERSQVTMPLPAGVEGRIGTDSLPGEPIMLVPTQGGIQLGMIHAKGVIDTGVNDPNNQLSAEASLRRAFFNVHRRYPNERELTSTETDGLKTWRMTISAGIEVDASDDVIATSLIRERIYVQLGNARGLLLDALSEPDMYTYTNNLVTAIATSARSGIDQPGDTKSEPTKNDSDGKAPSDKDTLELELEPDPEADAKAEPDSNSDADAPAAKGANSKLFLGAYRRGQLLGTHMRKTLGKRFTENWYFMLEHWRGKLNSVRMTRWYRTDDPDLPLWGRSIRRVVDRKQVTRGDWRASEDGSVIDGVKVVQQEVGGKMIQAGHRVQLVGDRLTTTLTPKQGDNHLSLIAPAGYIPMIAAEVWPMDAVYDLVKAGPSVIWQSYETTFPEPAWLEAIAIVAEPQITPTGTTADSDAADNAEAKATDAGGREHDEPAVLGAITNPPNGAAAVLTIRPIMGMETTRIWLDAKGQTVHHTTYLTEGQPAGGIRIDLSRVTRKAALRELDSLQETIFQWSMEKPDPGMQP